MKKIYTLIAAIAFGSIAFGQQNSIKALDGESSPSIKGSSVEFTGENSKSIQTNSLTSKSAQATLDTLTSHFTGTPSLYRAAGNKGYLAGHSGYGLISHAQRFDAAYGVIGNGTINSVLLRFKHKEGNPASTISVNIYDDNAGKPGTILGSTTLDFASIDTALANLTTATFASPITIPANNIFWAGFTVTYAAGDTLGLITTRATDFPNAITHTFYQLPSNAWASYGSSNLNFALGVFPVVDQSGNSFDGGVVDVTVPSACDITGKMPVTVSIANFGTDSLYDFEVSYTANAGSPVTAYITDTILPGDTLTYVFQDSLDMTVIGDYDLLAYTDIVSDATLLNDTAAGFAENVKTKDLSVSPMTTSFEPTDDWSGFDPADDMNNDFRTWTLYADPAYDHVTPQFYGIFGNATTTNDWFFLKCTEFKASNTYSIKYWKRSYTAAVNANMAVHIGSNQTSTAMSQIINAPALVSSVSYIMDSTSFTVPSDGIYFIGFQATQGSSASQVGIMIDDITVTDLGLTVGINETAKSSISIYPNPSTGNINISLPIKEKAQISVFNVIGEMVYSEQVQNTQLKSINLNAAQGTYFVKVKTDAGVSTQKIVISY